MGTFSKSAGLIRLGWLAGLVALVPVVCAFKSRLFPQTLESQARNVLECEIKGDGGCVENYCLDEEAKAYGISEELLNRLLSDYINPAYTDVSGAMTEDMQPLRDQGEFTAIYMWKSSGNRVPQKRSVTLAATPAGAKAPGVIREMISEAMFAKYRQIDDDSIYTTLIRAIRKDAKQLNSLGITGFFDDQSKKLIPWDQLVNNWQVKLDQHRTAQTAEKPQHD